MILFVVNATPLVSFAQVEADSGFSVDSLSGPLVPCGAEKGPVVTDGNGKETADSRKVLHPCNFGHVFLLLNKIISYVFKALVVPIAAIMFAYAGFQMLFSGGNAGKSEKAKGIFMNVAVGLIIAAAAWLIIHEVLNIVGFNGTAFGLE
jgi:hypothetical protein